MLVYDDDEAALVVMRETLHRSGARVTVARTLDDVLRVVGRERVDAVATDSMMARSRACALVIALRTSEDRRARRVPLVQLRCASS